MKILKFTFLLALVLLGIQTSFGQLNKPFSQDIVLREGANTIKLDNNKGYLLVVLRNDKIVSMAHKSQTGKITNFKLKDDGQTEGNLNCPNGYYCYEDHEQLMSICVCRQGGGRIKLEDVLITG